MALTGCRNVRCGLYIFIRTFHTALVLGIFSTFIYKKTALHNAMWSGNVVYAASFILLMLLSLAMYHLACWTDPGYVPLKSKGESWEDDETGDDDDVTLVEDGEGSIKLRRCGFCGIQQPLRTRHCEDCGRCVRKYDHHCPWLEACVGERNHRYFYMFLASTLALIIWGIAIVWPCLVFQRTWKLWFSYNSVFLIDLVVMVFSAFMTTALLCCHTYVVFSGQTTWELMARDRITYLKGIQWDKNPFHEGYMGNCLSFLCKSSIRRWERLYQRSLARHPSWREEQ